MTSRFRSILLLLLLAAASPLGAVAQQGATVQQAQRLADQLSQQGDLPVNVRLRFQVLKGLLPGITGKGDASNTLTFFSTTRILAWNRPVNAATGQTMRDFEAQMVGLARTKGFNLDLPPVGYSVAGTAGGAMPSQPNQTSSGTLLGRRATREALLEATLRAEELGTNALGSGAGSPQLQALRDSLTVLRLDLADTQISSDAVRNVLLARATYLASPAAAGANPELMQKLDVAADALRGNFPPELLRQARGQMLSI